MKYFNKLPLVMLFMLATVCTAHSQTVYEFTYKYGAQLNKAEHKVYFLRYDNGKALCRIRYTDVVSQKLVIVEMTLEEVYGKVDNGEIENNRLVYVPLSATIVNDVEGVRIDTSIRYLFVRNMKTGFGEPAGIINSKQAEPDPAAEFTWVLMESIKKSWLLNYFHEDDEMVGALAEGAKGLTAEEKKIKMWVLMVVDNKDEIIGNACYLDLRKMMQFFTDVSSYLGIRMDTTVISGNSYSKLNVEKAISRLQKAKPGSNDIVIFYYSGHGYRIQGDGKKYPWLDLRSDKKNQKYFIETLNMEDIFKDIRGMGARLNLVLSDCCNSDVTLSNAVGTVPMGQRDVGLKLPDEDNLRSLFLKTRASYLSTAADNGQRGCSNNNFGSFYTYFFKATLEYNVSVLGKNVNWDQIFNEVYTKTKDKAENTCCDKPCVAANACLQKPVTQKKLGSH